MKRQWATILAILLLVIVSLFAISNVDTVPVNFLFTVLNWPLIMVILGSLFTGALIAVLISTSSMYKSRKEIKESKKELNEIKAKKQQETEQNQSEMQQTMEKKLQDKNKRISELEERIHQLESNSRSSRL